MRSNPLQQNHSCRHSLFAIAANAANALRDIPFLPAGGGGLQGALLRWAAGFRGSRKPSAKTVQRHWSTVKQLAETFLCEGALAREQVLKLLLEASLDEALTEPQQG